MYNGGPEVALASFVNLLAAIFADAYEYLFPSRVRKKKEQLKGMTPPWLEPEFEARILGKHRKPY